MPLSQSIAHRASQYYYNLLNKHPDPYYNTSRSYTDEEPQQKAYGQEDSTIKL